VRAALAGYAATRRPELREDLVLAHLGLAHWAAARFAGRGEAVDDLVQVAVVGLVKAIDRFDPDRGPEFSGYAVSTMLGELKRHFRDEGWEVHLPRGVHDRYLRVRAAVDELTQELGRSPALDEVADRASVSTEQVVEATDVATAWRPASLDERDDSDDGDDRRHVPGTADPGFLAAEGRADFDPLLARLPPRARLVLQLRFVDDLTQSEIATRLGVSQMQVSRILSQTLSRLRAWHRERLV
jgi:RNA polymerase sigma-B factor